MKEFIIIFESLIIICLLIPLYWYWEFYKAQTRLNNWTEKERRINELHCKEIINKKNK